MADNAPGERVNEEALALLAGSVAHDFNNVLCTILGQSELLESKGTLDPKQVQRIQSIRAAAHRGVELTRKLAAFGLSRGVFAESLSAADVLTDLLAVYALSLPNEKSLNVQIQGGVAVFAERNALLQVVSELLVNARDFSGPAGEIRLSIYTEKNEGVWVVVEDQGPGFSSELDLERVLEPFVGTRGRTGRGIGLAAIHGVMKAHGGRVECSNNPGARVACFFPGSSPRPKAIKSAPNVSVWVLEDEPALLDFIVDALATQGFAVEPFLGARSLMEAYVSGEKPDPDVLLLDVVLPDVSGPDLLEELQRKGFASSVLWSSGFTPEATQLKVGGREGFLQKPYTSRDLCEAVARLVN